MKQLQLPAFIGAIALLISPGVQVSADDNTPPPGFTALFNGKDLTGWQIVVDPTARKGKTAEQIAELQKAANEKLKNWSVRDGALYYDGKGYSLQTVKEYGDFEMWVDWKIGPMGDSGIYLRGHPQVQIWDPEDKHPEGSGGLYNNAKNPNKPTKCADKPIGQWNTFRIVMKGEKVSVWLNGEQVVDNVTMENYWDRKDDPSKPIPARGPIELQHHGNPLEFKNIYIKEL